MMPIEAIIAILVAIVIIILIVLMIKIKNRNIKNEVRELQVRYNAIKTIPLSFKLNKATYIAKINDELAQSVESYRSKFEQAQKDLDEMQTLMTKLEDDLDAKKYSLCKQDIIETKEKMETTEKEVLDVESFLDSITQREQVQREHANELKDEYRELKQVAINRSNEMTIANEGIENRLKECENLFSSFEEQIYANDFINASEDLEKITSNLASIKKAIAEIPSLVKTAKGTIPTLMEEVENYYLKTKSKGICTNHISVELKLKEIKDNVNKKVKDISEANTDGAKEALDSYREQLEIILEALTKENLAFEDLKRLSLKIDQNLRNIEKTYYYIQKVYDNDAEKYNLNNLESVINNTPKELENYRNGFDGIGQSIKAAITPSSKILENANKLNDVVDKALNDLLEHKHLIDKTSNDENRANVQIVKLQIVLNEIEVKISQYSHTAISDTYSGDLKKCHDYIESVKRLLAEIPLNIENLNKELDDAIDYIYKLYNNVNNLVGTAVYVENAIVLGNKYRSSYPFVDAELSRAELYYMNGEYTQALTVAIACIEKLFPKKGDEKLVEYAKGIE